MPPFFPVLWGNFLSLVKQSILHKGVNKNGMDTAAREWYFTW